jgi:hypothetical protein
MRLFLAVLLLASSTALFAQKPLQVKATYSFMVREDLTLTENKEMAIRLAKVQAIKDHFGEVLIQGNSTFLMSSTSGSPQQNKQLYLFSSESILNGEYLRDLEPPKTKTYTDPQGKLWIEAHVLGLASGLEHKEPTFTAKLAHCPDEKCFTSQFVNGQDFLVQFQAGRSGYLYVFLDDVDENKTKLVFPLNNEELQITSDPYFTQNERVWLFDGGALHTKSPYSIVADLGTPDATSIGTKQESINKIYFIFAPQPLKLPRFQASGNASTELEQLDEMPLENFQSWLHKLRAINKDLEYYWELFAVRRPY